MFASKQAGSSPPVLVASILIKNDMTRLWKLLYSIRGNFLARKFEECGHAAMHAVVAGNSAWGHASNHTPVQQPLQQNGLLFQQQPQEQNASPLSSFANGPVAQHQQQPQQTAAPDYGSVESQWLQAVRLAAQSNGQRQEQHSDNSSQVEPNVWINAQPSAQVRLSAILFAAVVAVG